MNRTKVHVIINPKAGVKSKKNLPLLLHKHLPSAFFDTTILYTERAGHATELSQQAASKHVDIVVAIGGDGTINETAKGLINTNTSLAIVPMGSGNGLARHLNLPLTPEEAIQHIRKSSQAKIDVCYLNNTPFLCTAGIGFDAHISHVFDQAPTRGFITYFKLSLESFLSYKAKSFHLKNNQTDIKDDFLFVTIANANQWGNNAFVSPDSNLSDGLFEVCLIKPFQVGKSIDFARKLFTQQINSFSHYSSFSTNSIRIMNNNEIEVHVDGEPITIHGDITFNISPKSLIVRY